MCLHRHCFPTPCNLPDILIPSCKKTQHLVYKNFKAAISLLFHLLQNNGYIGDREVVTVSLWSYTHNNISLKKIHMQQKCQNGRKKIFFFLLSKMLYNVKFASCRKKTLRKAHCSDCNASAVNDAWQLQAFLLTLKVKGPQRQQTLISIFWSSTFLATLQPLALAQGWALRGSRVSSKCSHGPPCPIPRGTLPWIQPWSLLRNMGKFWYHTTSASLARGCSPSSQSHQRG